MKTNSKYGISVAALVLVDVVDEHPDSKKIGRKVARMINQYNIRANYIEACCISEALVNMSILIEQCGVIPDIDDLVANNYASTIVFYDLLVKDYLNRCDEVFFHKSDKQVKSFVKNVIKAKYKAWLDINLEKHKRAS